jgi:hypothetical protein
VTSILIAVFFSPNLASLDNPVALESYNFPSLFVCFQGKDGFILPVDDAFFKGENAFNIVPGLSDANLISIQAASGSDRYVMQEAGNIELDKPRHDEASFVSATFKKSRALADANDSSLISFESGKDPGFFIRHKNGRLYVEAKDGSDLFNNDATFRVVAPRTMSAKETVRTGNPADWLVIYPNIAFILYIVILGATLSMVIYTIIREKRKSPSRKQ